MSTTTLLTDPAPEITRTVIDFAQTSLPEYSGLYAVILDNVLSPAECTALIEAAEATSDGVWERAMVNIGNGRQEERLDTRNCGRIIWDDAEIVDRLWKRVEGYVPELRVLEPGCKALRTARAGKERSWRATRLALSWMRWCPMRCGLC